MVNTTTTTTTATATNVTVNFSNLFKVAKVLPNISAPSEVVTKWDVTTCKFSPYKGEAPQVKELETLKNESAPKRFDKNSHTAGYCIAGPRGKFVITDYIPKRDAPAGRTAVLNGVFVPKKGDALQFRHVDTWQLQILLRGYAIKEAQPKKEGKRKKALSVEDLSTASIEALEAAITAKKEQLAAAKAARIAALKAELLSLEKEA